MKKLFVLFLLFLSISHYAHANVMCEDATDYYAVYEPNTYTCNSGYYLPANTEGCQPCPNGFTCSGGTFEFNPNEYQGAELNTIGTSTMNNVCADNFPMDMYAVYEPKTVTLNFDDDNGHTSTTTCTYDGLVNLPEPPTRVGYDFKGWKLVQTNNE